jgi:phage N-6-adenine-methyltransferase
MSMERSTSELAGLDLFQLAELANQKYDEADRSGLDMLERYREIGLILIQAKRAAGHGGFLRLVKSKLKFGRMQAARYMRFARCNVDVTFGSFEEGWAAWQMIQGNESDAKVSQNSGENEWYTPPEYLGAARAVMGGIDLDPASSDIAQEAVKASIYYTRENDGLSKPWAGRVWMNPPYSSDLIGRFVMKLCDHFVDGDVTQAIVLVNDAMETAWAQRLSEEASAVCFPSARLKFLDLNGKPGAPLQGQAAFYLGQDASRFGHIFASFGCCWIRWRK